MIITDVSDHLCDHYFNKHGYMCDDCFDEMCKMGIINMYFLEVNKLDYFGGL